MRYTPWHIMVFLSLAFLFVQMAHADLSLSDDGAQFTVTEFGRPVLSYRYAATPGGKESAPLHYIHPIYGYFGETITGDDPVSSATGRSGIFWSWGTCLIGDRQLALSNGANGQRVFERWLQRSETPEEVVIGAQHAWVFRETGEAALMESTWLTVQPAKEDGRIIDIHIELKNISFLDIYLLGGTDGLCLQMNPERKQITFSGGQGIIASTSANVLSPWMDISYQDTRRSTFSGIALFQHSQNLGFSQPNWRLDPAGRACAQLSLAARHRLRPGEATHMRYRVLVHRGFGPNRGLNRAFSEFVRHSEP